MHKDRPDHLDQLGLEDHQGNMVLKVSVGPQAKVVKATRVIQGHLGLLAHRAHQGRA